MCTEESLVGTQREESCLQARKQDLPGHQPCQDLGFGLPASRTVRGIFVVETTVCGILLWQPQLTNAPVFRELPGGEEPREKREGGYGWSRWPSGPHSGCGHVRFPVSYRLPSAVP